MTARSDKSKRGASKSTRVSKKPLSGMPGWLWLITGVALGVFVAFLAGLTPSAKDVRTVAEQVNSEPVDGQERNREPVFDFYTLLPESEVTLPMTEPEPAKTSPVKADKATVGQVTAPKKSEKPRKYLLQAGSFRSFKDAERLRVQLLLEGLTPKVEKVSVGGGETWHRVQLGPFTDRASLQSAQKVLAGKNIDSLLLQLK